MSHRVRLARPAFAVAAVAIVAAACTGGSSRPTSSPSPSSPGSPTSTSSSGPRSSCAWTSQAVGASDRAIAVSGDAVYELVDLSSGRVLDRCATSGPNGVGSFSASYQAPTIAGRAPEDDSQTELWFGGFRPGGSDGTVVVTSDGVLDLTTGRRTAVNVPGFVTAAVGRAGIVLVRSNSTGQKAPPTRSSDWCEIPVSGVGQCVSIPGAAGPGTPVVTRDGSIRWLTNAMTRSSIQVVADGPVRLYLRTGQGMVTATGTNNHGLPDLFPAERVSPDGRAFLYVPSSINASALDQPGRMTWFTVSDSGVRTEHRAAVSYRDVGALVGATGSTRLIDDTNVSADGKTLYLLLYRDSGSALVAVPQVGRPRVVFDTAKASSAPTGPGLVGHGDHFLSPLEPSGG